MDDLSDDKPGSAFRALKDWLNAATGIPKGVIHRLDDADDWTFVITMHAMIEAVLNNAITAKLAHPQLSDIIARIDTGNRQTGKLAWAKQLDILPETSRKFIRILSELRNDLAHNVLFFDFTFSKWISDMTPANFKNLRECMDGHISQEFILDGRAMTRDECAKLFPRVIIMAMAITIIVKLHLVAHPTHPGNESAPVESNPKESKPTHLQ